MTESTAASDRSWTIQPPSSSISSRPNWFPTSRPDRSPTSSSGHDQPSRPEPSSQSI